MRVQLPLVLLLASTTVACTTDESTPIENESDIVSALERENGGFDTSDEAPMFALEARFEEARLEADRPIADSLRDSEELRTLAAAPGVRSVDIVVMWGRFRADPNVPTRHDWSGILNMSGTSAVAVNRAIGFEDATDAVLPRTTRDRIQFTSVTGPRTDGLALRIIDTRGPNSPDRLQMKYTPDDTQGEAYVFDIDDALAGPVVVVDYGNGNQLVAMARPHRDDCDTGFVRGRWHALAPNVSAYLGVVLNADGEIVGHMRGIAGQRRDGRPVFFGKWINREGQFRGLLAGSYTDDTVFAKLIDRGGTEGEFTARYRAGESLRHGGFAGRWQETACGPSLPPGTRP